VLMCSVSGWHLWTTQVHHASLSISIRRHLDVPPVCLSVRGSKVVSKSTYAHGAPDLEKERVGHRS